MKRTQIYLDDEIYEFLVNQSAKTRQSFSEIIRECVRAGMKSGPRDILLKMEAAAGTWPETEESPDAFVRRMRRDRSL